MKNSQGGVDVFPWSTDKLPKDVPLSIRDLLGRPLRVVDENALITQEYIPGRVTIRKTKDGRIKSISIEAEKENSS